MKPVRVISTAVLFLLLGTIAPAYAQQEKAQEAKPAQHAQQAQRAQPAQHAQRSQPAQRTQQVQRSQGGQRNQQAQRSQPTQHAQQVQRSQPAQRTQQAQRSQGGQRNQQAQRSQGRQNTQQAHISRGGQDRQQGQLTSGRIPDARFRSGFGSGHVFQINQPVVYGGYSSFQYGGYWFDFDQPWPSDWAYSDDVYVDYYGNVYYLYNRRHRGVRIEIRIAI